MINLSELIVALRGQINNCAATEGALCLNQVTCHSAFFPFNHFFHQRVDLLSILELGESSFFERILKVLLFNLSFK